MAQSMAHPSDWSLLMALAPISALIMRWFGEGRTATVATLTAVTGIILTGYADTAWHVLLSLGILTCKIPNYIHVPLKTKRQAC